MPDADPMPPWQHERDLKDTKAGVGIQVYKRFLPTRDKNDPLVVQRSYQVASIDQQGQFRRHFYAWTTVDEAGRVTVRPFPTEALQALVATVAADHAKEQQARVDGLRRGRTEPKERRAR